MTGTPLGVESVTVKSAEVGPLLLSTAETSLMVKPGLGTRFTIVATAEVSVSVVFVGFESMTENCLFGWDVAEGRTGTEILVLVDPAGMVSVPVVAT